MCLAPSGTDALNIRVQTLQSFCGFGAQMNKSLEEFILNAKVPAVQARIMSTDVLVIDEFSMVSNEDFQRVDAVLRAARALIKNNGAAYKTLPFGGVQVIITGDPCQLPPVLSLEYCIECGRARARVGGRNSKLWECATHGTVSMDDQWIWKAKVWQEIRFKFVRLHEIHRQRNPVFQSLIHTIWLGNGISRQDKRLLMNHISNTHNAIISHPKNYAVDAYNKEQFKTLKVRAKVHKCRDEVKSTYGHEDRRDLMTRDPKGTLTQLQSHRYKAELSLKVGMPVMLLANLDLDGGFVNSSQSRMFGFHKYQESELPGMSGRVNDPDLNPETSGLDKSHRLLSVYGGGYTAIRKEQVRHFMKDNPRARFLPIVKFSNGKTAKIWPDCSILEFGIAKPHMLLKRTQILVMPNYAMSIHKAQGMTIERVVVDVSNCFAYGQFYTALSRAKTMEGLKVNGLNDVKAPLTSRDPEVHKFLDSIKWYN